MIKIAVVGCTGKLGRAISKKILNQKNVQLSYAIARKGNEFVGKNISEIVGGNSSLMIIDDIESANECDVFIDCTNANSFISNNYDKYQKMKKPLVIATTAFSSENIEQIRKLSSRMPIFMTGNFSIALHDFIDTLKFAVKRISDNTDIQILEYHHNQKKDSPSGTALMIKDSLLKANELLVPEKINTCCIRGGNIFGEHEVIFANSKDEVITFKHQVTSREAFADGAIKVAVWIINQSNGMYNMDNFCDDIIG